jgi:N-acetylmuramoyl-L-alanine amidase
VTDPARAAGSGACRPVPAVLAAAVTGGLLLSACAASAGPAAGTHRPATTRAASGEAATASPSGAGAGSPPPAPSRSAVRLHARALAGEIVGIDPGHNGLNYTSPAFLDHKIWNGRQWENCNTTGTQTASGYTEAQFNFNVATFLAADLSADGAQVVLTRTNNHGIGPCVNRRIQIIDDAHANVAIDIHADSGPSWGRGFTVLEPVADGTNSGVVAPSARFGGYVRSALLGGTPFRLSNYYGRNGLILRDNLAGLNLATVPVVLIECGNMASAAEARLLTSPVVQRQIARALEAAIIRFLTGRWPGRHPGAAAPVPPGG